MPEGKKQSPKSLVLEVNHLIMDEVAWHPVNNTSELKNISGDQWRGIVSCQKQGYSFSWNRSFYLLLFNVLVTEFGIKNLWEDKKQMLTWKIILK